MANQNFTVKVDLRDANIISESLAREVAYLTASLGSEEIRSLPPEEVQTIRTRIMDLERIIRVNFA